MPPGNSRHHPILLKHWLTCFHVQLSVTAMLAARTTAPSLPKMVFNRTDHPGPKVPMKDVDVAAEDVVATLIDTAEVLEGKNILRIRTQTLF